MFRAYFFVLISLLLLSFQSFAQGKTILINQVAKTFTTESDEKILVSLKEKPWKAVKLKVANIEAVVGDTLIFHNSDDFVHNVYSNFFDLKTQEPGKSSEVRLNKEGTFEVQCAIHPKMKLLLKVKKK